MRTIKFRAYAAGKMYYPQSFCFDMGGKRISFQPDDGGGGTFVSEEFAQFTGLQDKNGKEIYEGDIVMVINYLNGKPWTGHVHPCAVESVPGGFELKDHWHHESLRSSELEVIGNIYEHPDLLK